MAIICSHHHSHALISLKNVDFDFVGLTDSPTHHIILELHPTSETESLKAAHTTEPKY